MDGTISALINLLKRLSNITDKNTKRLDILLINYEKQVWQRNFRTCLRGVQELMENIALKRLALHFIDAKVFILLSEKKKKKQLTTHILSI